MAKHLSFITGQASAGILAWLQSCWVALGKLRTLLEIQFPILKVEIIICNGLNFTFPQNASAEILTPHVMALRGGAFRE
jgi:hypothetical protein